MRPAALDQVAGQAALIGPRGFLRRAIEADRVPSIVFWGPPGTGKTTLARIVATQTASMFVPFSAVSSGIKEIREVMSRAERLGGERGVVVFVDEIHRFNRAQQDAFLPYVERGDIVLIGATTENPSFELNRALLSRCRVLMLEPLSSADLESLLERALTDREVGLGASGVELDAEALQALVQLSSGDARRALGQLELVVADAERDDRSLVTMSDVTRAVQKKVLLYDKSGDEHFQQISALHKSLRESDPDAAAYWLLRMIEAGEDPRYVARRMLRFAAEDIGTADPGAVGRAVAAWQGYERLGSPEGDLLLVQLAIDFALAPKSIAVYRAEKEIRAAIAESPAEPVPMSLRNAPTELMKNVGFGSGYAYAPNVAGGVAGLECLPQAVRGTKFFKPSGEGAEVALAKRVSELDRLRAEARRLGQSTSDAGSDVG